MNKKYFSVLAVLVPIQPSISTLPILQLLKSEEDASYKPVKKACTQLVDNLVEHILKYEESLAGKMSIFKSLNFLPDIQSILELDSKGKSSCFFLLK